MTVSLRERRRQQTAREIQLATLELAHQHELENVTTEEIAAAAGVSTRTFFNYFTNKEAAAVGAPPPFREEDKNALAAGTGALADDIKQFLDRHIEDLGKDDPIIKMMGRVIRSNEKASGILEGFLKMERDELTDCLCKRVQNRQTAASLAGATTSAIGRAIYLWNHEPDLSLGAALDMAWEGLLEASVLLTLPARD
ncbi:transcriptional regulator, TetR family [Monaibacterium marinum]|uniref:Transcriptional regulator, TetR family n=1 Tax=Pontivivens marinum TaxID=1690039 RepID=A0A2C9CVU1_9RHOB|nr:TetR/AcrR family transcriptional regulator [Monaibacterium marinum]SOH95333.1 transcriptional regulator, TetR family [Monaibacterium marinum]